MSNSSDCLSVVFFTLLAGVGLAQGPKANEPFQAMMKTIGWPDKLKSFDIEVTANTDTKSVSPVDQRSGTFAQRIEKFREFRSSDGRFFIAKSEGLTSLRARNGRDNAIDLSMSHCMFGNKTRADTISLVNGREQSRSSPDCGNGISCDSAVRGFHWGQMVLFTMLEVSDESQTGNLDVILERVLEQDSFAITSDTTQGNRKVTEYRFKKNFNKGPALAYVLTVSDDGVEKGMVVELKRLRMKDSEKNNPFTSDDQCLKSTLNSSSIKWREVEFGEGLALVPAQVIQINEEGPLSTAKRVWTFRWNSTKEPDASNMSIEACQKICVQFAKDIDRILGR